MAQQRPSFRTERILLLLVDMTKPSNIVADERTLRGALDPLPTVDLSWRSVFEWPRCVNTRNASTELARLTAIRCDVLTPLRNRAPH
jgi:hypothetical protein